MGISASGSDSESESEFGNTAAIRAEAGRSGLDFLKNLGSRLNAFQSQKANLLDLQPSGLTSGVNQLFQNALRQSTRQAFTGASASAANRGQLQPHNVASLATEAGRRATTQLDHLFAPLSNKHQRFNVKAQQGRDVQALSLLSQLGQLFSSFTQGGTGTRTASSFGFGANLPASGTGGGSAPSTST